MSMWFPSFTAFFLHSTTVLPSFAISNTSHLLTPSPSNDFLASQPPLEAISQRKLVLDASGFEARRILRRLRLLGHLEVSRDGTHWAICPPCLVTIETRQRRECILAGQRCVQLLKEIEKVDGVEIKSMKQPNDQAPKAIHVHMDSEDILNELMREIRHYFPIIYSENASYKLAEILPSLEEWRDSLTPVGRFLPALYQVERFTNGTFTHCDSYEETGMYRLHPRDRNSQMSRTLFYHQDSDQWLQGDWYGLRFLALRVFTLNLKGASTSPFNNEIWGPLPKWLLLRFVGHWHT